MRGGGDDPARVQLWEAGMRVWQDTEWQGRGDGEFHLGGKQSPSSETQLRPVCTKG